MKQIVRRPLVSEKSLLLAAKGWYTFVVDISTTKQTAARAIEKLYSVNVTNVRTMIMHGKQRRVGRKQKSVQKSDWKKALIQLKEGQSISAFEVTPEGEKK